MKTRLIGRKDFFLYSQVPDYKVIILALKAENLSSVANNAISKLKAEGTKLHGKMIDNVI